VSTVVIIVAAVGSAVVVLATVGCVRCALGQWATAMLKLRSTNHRAKRRRASLRRAMQLLLDVLVQMAVLLRRLDTQSPPAILACLLDRSHMGSLPTNIHSKPAALLNNGCSLLRSLLNCPGVSPG
jgi:hypothetical protein